MMIDFLCPNGHQLKASPDRIGKPGKCPKCGSKFVVPEADEDEEEVEAPAKKGETIAFLCPNGHHLTGPARLQGRPGQCPHCGERFHIPTYEDGDEADDSGTSEEDSEATEEKTETVASKAPPPTPQLPEKPEEEIPVGIIIEDDAETTDADDIIEFPEDALEVVDESEIADADDWPSEALAEAPAKAPVAKPPPLLEHPMARAFFQFWNDRDKDSSVEVQLRSGETISPDKVSVELLREGYAAFAEKEDADRFTVTTVLWDDISGIRFRKLKELPDRLFE